MPSFEYRKGIWMGGQTPLGYDVKNRKLHVNHAEAEIVRFIFEHHYNHCSFTKLLKEIDKRGWRTKLRVNEAGETSGGKKIDKNHIYRILKNPVYIGQIKHKDKVYKGEQEPLISEEMWKKVNDLISSKEEKRKLPFRSAMPSILKGIIFDMHGNAMTPGYTKRGDKLYRYYISVKAIKHGYEASEIRSVPAEEVEKFVIAKMRELLETPEMLNNVHRQAWKRDSFITLDYIRDTLADFNTIWNHLFPIEKTRIMHLVVSRIVVSPHGLHITFHEHGLYNLCEQMAPQYKERAA